MYNKNTHTPIILTLSTLDPSGTGGIQADIETASSLGGHCAPIVTSMCAEGFQTGVETFATDETIVIEQARSILSEMDVQAVKLGFLGSTSNVEAVHSILNDFPDIPIVANPALCLYDEDNIDQNDYVGAYNTLIVPLTTVLVCSLFEARELAQEADSTNAAARTLINRGCEYLLITGSSKQEHHFVNTLYHTHGKVKDYTWEEEPPTSHGAGATMTTSAATHIAHGFNVPQSIDNAQNYTWQAMRASRELGFNRRTPHRLYWADKNIEAPDTLPAGKHTH